jgi:signal transduction histidine kinase
MSLHAANMDPVDSRRSEDPFAGVVCPVLRASLREVAAELAPRWDPGSEDEASFNHELTRRALRLDGGAAGRGLQGGGGRPDGLDARAEAILLAALRRSLLEQWRRRDLAVDPDRVLELLYSIDRLAEELAPGPGGLEARLAEPDAFGLLAEVAHDLRSPLTSILFLSEAMRNGHSGSHTLLQQRQLGLIYSAALGLTGVANDLMTAAQERGSGQLEEAAAFSLHESCEAVREMVEPMAEAKEIDLRFNVNCFGHRTGHAGPLGRVLLNLVTNAIRFTHEGGAVDVVLDPLGPDTVKVSVSDTGRGISPELQARLFEPFQKSHGREGYFFAASGLGLSIVRRLLERMDSKLTIESEVGMGTTFSFALRLPAPH